MKKKGIKKGILLLLSLFVALTTVVVLILPATALSSEAANEDPGINLGTVNNSETQTDYVSKDNTEPVENNNQETVTGQNSVGVVEEKEPLKFYGEAGNSIVYVEAPYDAFPEGTTMEVKEVILNSDQYDSINDQIKDKEVKVLKALDITFRDKDNNEVEPKDNSKVKVSITDKELSELDNAFVAHIDEKEQNPSIIEDVETKPEDVEVLTNTEEITEIVENNDSIDEITVDNTVTFETDSFSLYVLAYTVDFYYGEYEYHLEGGSEIGLIQLFNELGIDIDIDNVESVEFSNTDLVSVYHVEGNWILESKEAFDTVETLTIRLKDGGEIAVRVEDETIDGGSINNLLYDASISGGNSTTEGNTWHLTEPYGNYSISLYFLEDSGKQFPRISDPNGDSLTFYYVLPAGIEIGGEQRGEIQFYNSTLKETVNIPWSITDDHKRIVFTLDNSTKNYVGNTMSAYEVFDNAVTAGIRMSFTGKWDEQTTQIEFSTNVKKDISTQPYVPEPGTLDINKNGSFNYQTGKIDYSITIEAKGGDVASATINDILSNNAGITIDQNSLIIAQNEWPVDDSTCTYSGLSSNGFELNLLNLTEGKVYTIKYSADVDFATLDPNKTGKVVLQPNNDLIYGDKTIPNTLNNEIWYRSQNKSLKNQSDLIEKDGKYYRELEWEISVNSNKYLDLSGTTLVDTIDQSKYPMEYTGDGLTIKTTDSSGEEITQTVLWSALSSYNKNTGWTYTFPENSGKKPYVITYKTKVDVTNLEDNAEVNNTFSYDYGNGSVKGTVAPAFDYNVSKTFDSFSENKENCVWKITLTVPKTGLSKAEVTDSFPYIDYNGSRLYDSFVEIEVDNLLPGENWVQDYENDGQIKIHFVKDSNNTPGLNASDSERTIDIFVTTKINKQWASISSLSTNHTNFVEFNNKSDSATKRINYNQSLNKEVMVPYYPSIVTYNNIEYQCLKYTVVLNGINEAPVVLNDSLSDISGAIYWTNLNLDPINGNNWNDNLKLYYYDNYNYNDSGKYASINSDSSPVTFTIPDDNLVKDSNGDYFGQYKFSYYVLVPISNLQSKAAESSNHEYNLINNVAWGNLTSQSTYTTTYQSLDKKLLNEGELGGNNRLARYQITVNPGASQMNNGQPYELTDTFSDSLAIDYSSISFSNQNAVISYSVSGNTVSYLIKDEMSLTITYNARVLGNGRITLDNTASTKWATKNTTSSRDFNSSSGGEGASPVLKLLKVDGDNAKIRLNGIKFILSATDSTIKKYLESFDKSLRTFTTDSKGEVEIKAPTSGYQLYFDTEYTLTEDPDSVPENYTPLSRPYRFTISSNGTTDWTNYIYYNNYNLQIKNYVKKGNIDVSKQVISSIDDDKTNRTYEFDLTLYSDINHSNIATTINGLFGDVSFNQGVSNFSLKHGQTVNISNIPEGLYYVISEHDYSDMNTTINGVVTNTASGVVDSENDKSVEFVNKRVDETKTSHSVSKTWISGDENAGWPNNIDHIEVTLFMTIDNLTSIVSDSDVPDIVNPKTINSSTGEIEWTDLPLKLDDKDVVYFAKETKIVYTDQTFKNVSVQENNNEIINSVVYDFNILKVDKDDNSIKLSNVEFSLNEINPDNATITTISSDISVLTNEEGIAKFTDLAKGYYMIRETKTKDGYIFLSDPVFYIKVDENGVYLLSKNDNAPKDWVVVDAPYGIIKEYDTSIRLATIENSKGSALPMTGGVGSTAYINIGSTLIFISSLLFIYKFLFIEKRRN